MRPKRTDFAASEWILDELVEILCRKKKQKKKQQAIFSLFGHHQELRPKSDQEVQTIFFSF